MQHFEFYVMILPLIIRGIREYPAFQKNYKYRSAKGYAYLVLLPFLFVYLSNLAIIENFKSSPFLLPVTLLTTLGAIFLSSLFFTMKVKHEQIDRGTEKWFMTRFYRDVFYSILLAIPALVKFFLLI